MNAHLLLDALTGPTPAGLREAIYSGVFDASVPELRAEMDFPQNTPYHAYSILDHSLMAAWYLPVGEERLTGLLHDIGKHRATTINPKYGHEQYIGHPEKGYDIAFALLTRLGFPADDVRRICRRIGRHMILHMAANDAVSAKSLDKVLLKLGADFEPLCRLQLADIAAMSPRIAETKGGEAVTVQARLRARAADVVAGAPSQILPKGWSPAFSVVGER